MYKTIGIKGLENIKWLIHNLYVSHKDKKIIYIVGCQRSGTSMLQRVFKKDIKTKVFGERNGVTNVNESSLRLKSVAVLKRVLNELPAPIAILKPLAETQCIRKYIEEIKNSTAIFMFRNYKDVAQSYVKAFKDSVFEDVESVFNNESTKKWISESVDYKAKYKIKQEYNKGVSCNEAVCLLWFARNKSFLDQKLLKSNDALIVKYEDYVKHPYKLTNKIYEKVNMNMPNYKLTKNVHGKSVGKGSKINVNKSIRKMCDDVMFRLEDARLRV